MKKDWFIWVGCASLFVTGMIWGGVPIPTDFFKVKDIHDLFEIASSGATVIAVCLAAAGFNAWKLQILATSDHDLAKRAAIALHAYQAAVVRGFELAEILENRISLDIRGLKPHLSDGISRELERLDLAILNARALSFECKVGWGEEFWAGFQSVLLPGEKYSHCIESFLRWSKVDASDSSKEGFAKHVSNSFNYMIPMVGVGKASFESAMDYALSPLYTKIHKKFLSHSSS